MSDRKVKKSPWARFGKALHILVVAAFFLPFFGITCRDKGMRMTGDPPDFITFSGADMAMGCAPGGLIAQAKDTGTTRGMDMDIKIDKVKIEPLAIIALLLAVAGVLVAFLAKGRQAIMGSLIVSVLCLGTVVGIWIKVGADIKDEITTKMQADMEKNSMMKDATVSSGPRMGLWISLACLAACAGLAGLSLRDRNSTMPEVVPPGPPSELPPARAV